MSPGNQMVPPGCLHRGTIWYAAVSYSKARLEGPRQPASRLVSDRVDRLTLSTSIVMVDPETLVVAADESDLDELGDRAAYVRPARLADALTNRLRYRRLRLVGA